MASNYFALQYTIGLSKITKQIMWRLAELMPKCRSILKFLVVLVSESIELTM
mgnify:CR=1|jgi:hypothetical protein